jgi:hypothetical protein
MKMKFIGSLSSQQAKKFVSEFLDTELQRVVRLTIGPDNDKSKHSSIIMHQIAVETDEQLCPVAHSKPLLENSFEDGSLMSWIFCGFRKVF